MTPSVEIAVRVGCYAVFFATMALWEWFAPRRHLTVGRRPRWPGNLGILAIDIIAVRLPVPTAAVGVALIAAAHGWGLLHLLALPGWAAIPVGVVALDLVIYTQHVVFHHVPMLWRLHRMHHTDLDLDVTTGVRFHPLEILLSLAIKMAAVLTLGVPALAVLIFEVLLNATSMFNHSNVVLPPRLEFDRTLDRGHAADASGASLDRTCGNRQQFRIQSAVVGSPIRHLSRQTGGRRRANDDRPADLPQRGGIGDRASADAAVSE